MKMTGAEIVIKLLENQGVTRIAGIPGGSNLPLYDALFKSTIRHILVRHEQAAGFMAQGEARVTGRAAVCFATSGPGATNLLTAVADAKLDSIPLIAITGQVPTGFIGTDAFQEVDTYGLSTPITKHSYLVKRVEDLVKVIPEAFTIAESGRPGPVWIDIPKDVQKAVYELDVIPRPGGRKAPEKYTEKETILEAVSMIHSSQYPVLYIGGGVRHAHAYEEIRNLAEKNGIPVTSTLMGLGSFPQEHPLYIGMLGMHAARYTNYILEEADLLIAVGVRFDDRATGRVEKFCPNAKVIHIDIDAAEIHKIRKAHISMVGDAREVLKALLPKIQPNHRSEWKERMQQMKDHFPYQIPNEGNPLNPVRLIRMIRKMVSDNTPVATDVGQHQMWVAQAYLFVKPETLLTSGGAGTMGFGLPAAMGAAAANPGTRVICFSGDGSLLMNIQELDTLAEEKLDVTIILMNNNALGLVRQQQELFYEKHYIATRYQSKPDFAKIAKGFGIRSFTLDKAEEAGEMIQKALNCKGPCLVDVHIAEHENVLPIVPPGAANIEMIDWGDG